MSLEMFLDDGIHNNN